MSLVLGRWRVSLRMPQAMAALGLPLLLSLSAAWPAAQAQPADAAGPPIAAASDLKFALDELAADFKAKTGQGVRLTYGSSGNFFRQIAQGAPFELFLSADEAWVDRLAEQQLTPDRGVLYGIGRIVLFAPHGARWRPDAQLSELGKAVADGRVSRFAIAHPEHAPYGRAAKQALQSAGLWPAIEARLVLGENVSQAAQFAASGSAQGGIIALSLALAPAVAATGGHVLIPESMHQPLRQRMALTKKAGPVARAFYAYLQQPDARAVLRRHGFTVPATLAP